MHILIIMGIVAIVIFGGIARDYVKTSKARDRLFRKDIEDLIERMGQLESDMAELSELVSTTIIENA